MAKEEIIAGLKNAVERGESLERAKYSFISAGYPKEEVEEASQFVYSGSVLAQEKSITTELPIKAIKPSSKFPQKETTKMSLLTKLRSNTKIILLIIILMILILIFILTIIFKGDIINWFV